MGIKEIAVCIDAPEQFIAKILHELTKKNLVQSLKGPTGGFYLDKHSRENSLADIVKAIDGDKIFSGCGLGLNYCSEVKPCPIHNEFKKVREDIYALLENARIGEFSKQLEKNIIFLKRK